jgi:hypothetical protein
MRLDEAGAKGVAPQMTNWTVMITAAIFMIRDIATLFFLD